MQAALFSFDRDFEIFIIELTFFSGHSYSCDRGPAGDSVWLSHANFARTRILTAMGTLVKWIDMEETENTDF